MFSLCELLRMQKPLNLEPVPGLLRAYGTEVPQAGINGFAIGCLFQLEDDEGEVYINRGTLESCDFQILASDGGGGGGAVFPRK